MMIKHLSLYVFAGLIISLLAFCAPESNYSKAKNIYETKYKKLGHQFYRTADYKTVRTLLGKISKNNSEYNKAQDLMKRMKKDFREYRQKNVRSLLVKTKEQLKKQEEQEKVKKDPYSNPGKKDTTQNEPPAANPTPTK